MFNYNTRLQQLAISCRVPAWNVCVDPNCRNPGLQKLQLVNEHGYVICEQYARYDHSWERFEIALREFAVLPECQKGWARYAAENMPIISTFGEL